MSSRKLDRRTFLKLALATAAGAGLSHFRILNVGGPGVAHAGLCGGPPPRDPDYCAPMTPDPDECIPPTDPDECKPALGDVDECTAPDDIDYDCAAADTCDPSSDPDICSTVPPAYPDVCAPPNDLDSCVPQEPSDPDECTPSMGDLDYACTPTDICSPASGDPDWCDPWWGHPDECTAPGDTDFQCNIAGDDTCGVANPDLCEPAYEPDECLPPDDADLPSAVDVISNEEQSETDPGSLALPALGLAAALGGAAIALRRRGQASEPEEDPA